MMKGNNELHLNEATMIEIVQMWIDKELLPGASNKVTSICQRDHGVFIVGVKGEEEQSS
jgi:hypothetical protein